MLAQLAAMGRSTQVQLLDFAYVEPPLPVAQALGTAAGERVQRAVRVRHARKEPFSYLVTFVPTCIGERFSKRDLARTPLLELLERSGVVAERATQTISATLAGPEVAAALKVEVGAPLLSLTRVVFDVNKRGVEYLNALYRPDAHVIRMELTRQGRGTKRYWQATGGIPTLRSAQAKTNPIKTSTARRKAA
jgi:GntR family transcriptional regulator